MNVLIGFTGSVATILLHKIVKEFTDRDNKVKVIFTERAEQFIDLEYPRKWHKYVFDAYYDYDEFAFTETPYETGKPITHIELRDWADVFLICPCSANTMAKICNGICDNLLTSVARAWDFKKPFYIAPAMNTQMWLHPCTKNHLDTLKSWNINVIYPTVKKLECGEFGIGALADLTTIANIVEGHRWAKFLYYIGKCDKPYLPLFPHLGGFGAVRKHDIHTGVDNYCTEIGPFAHAAEDGVITSTGVFTGEKAECPWYNETFYITVKGKSGLIVYGELTEPDKRNNLNVGEKVKAGQFFGSVGKVLKNGSRKDIEGHSDTMLHLELLKQDSTLEYSPGWHDERPKDLLDPTPYLYLMTF